MALNNNLPDRDTLVLDKPKVALCRCWQSSRFPYCDGSHREYNEKHQDHLGPIIVQAVESE